jgi:hypothetical protein
VNWETCVRPKKRVCVCGGGGQVWSCSSFEMALTWLGCSRKKLEAYAQSAG